MRFLFVTVVFLTGCSCGDGGGGDDDGGGGGGGDGDVGRDGGGGGGGDGSTPGNCDVIPAVVRDMDVSHSDFEDDNPGLVPGLVMDTVDAERKPVYAHGSTRMGGIDSEDSFREWYRDVDGVNMRFDIELPLTEETPGHFVYDNAFFFPVDGMGFGMSGLDRNDVERNFHFTTEIHTAFVYQGGEEFTFRGDDDLWLFIDGQLVIDLGGVHGAETDTVQIDDLGLTVGEQYRMDIFHAERHTHASNFRIETTIECFVDPGPI